MVEADDRLLRSFAENGRECLSRAAKSLAALRGRGEKADLDPLNRMFRAVHSIRAGAGFLGLEAIRSLALALEHVLLLMREGDVAVSDEVRAVLSMGLDRLNYMFASTGMDDADVAEVVEALHALLPEEARRAAQSVWEVADEGGRQPFSVSELTLTEGVRGCRRLYRIEFDLLRDVREQQKTPLDVFAMLLESGLVLGSKVDLQAAGDLEAGPKRDLPLCVLYATILDAEIASMLFGIPEERIKAMPSAVEMLDTCPGDAVLAEEAVQADEAVPEREGMAGYEFLKGDGRVVVRLGERETVERVAELRTALVAAFALGGDVLLDPSELRASDLAFAQLVAAAAQSARSRGTAFGFSHEPGESVRATFKALGLDGAIGVVA